VCDHIPFRSARSFQVELFCQQGERGGNVAHGQLEGDVVHLIVPDFELESGHVFHLDPEMTLKSFQRHQ
jgi:hypothetical protein